jgi:hypothetical protein
MRHALVGLLLLIAVTLQAGTMPPPPGGGGGPVIGKSLGCGPVAGKIPKTDAAGIAQCSDDAGATTGAPTTSTYMLRTLDGALPNAFVWGNLATALILNTTGTGIPTTYTGTGPVANQFLRSLNALGVGTFAPVGTADITDGAIVNADVNASAAIAESKLALGFATHSSANDPTASEKAALAGTSGTAPSSVNKLVDNADNRLPAVQTPAALSASSQINADKPTQIITGSGVAVTLTNPKWLTDGDFAGQTVELFNPSATNTVTGPTTATIINCGGTGSVVIGLNQATPKYTWTGTMWQLGGCLGLQQQAQTSKLIDLTGTQLQLREGNSGWDFKVVAGLPVLQGIEAGGPTNSIIDLSAGKDFLVRRHTGETIFGVDNDTSTITGLAIGPSVLGANNNSAFTCSSGGDFSYNYPFGRTTGAEAEVRMRVPRTGNAAKLRVRLGSPIAAGHTALFTLRKNGGATALACSIIGGLGVGIGEVGTNSDVECNDITDAIPLVAGTDDINIEIVCSGGTTAMPTWTTAFVIE